MVNPVGRLHCTVPHGVINAVGRLHCTVPHGMINTVGRLHCTVPHGMINTVGRLHCTVPHGMINAVCRLHCTVPHGMITELKLETGAGDIIHGGCLTDSDNRQKLAWTHCKLNKRLPTRRRRQLSQLFRALWFYFWSKKVFFSPKLCVLSVVTLQFTIRLPGGNEVLHKRYFVIFWGFFNMKIQY